MRRFSGATGGRRRAPGGEPAGCSTTRRPCGSSSRWSASRAGRGRWRSIPGTSSRAVDEMGITQVQVFSSDTVMHTLPIDTVIDIAAEQQWFVQVETLAGDTSGGGREGWTWDDRNLLARSGGDLPGPAVALRLRVQPAAHRERGRDLLMPSPFPLLPTSGRDVPGDETARTAGGSRGATRRRTRGRSGDARPAPSARRDHGARRPVALGLPHLSPGPDSPRPEPRRGSTCRSTRRSPIPTRRPARRSSRERCSRRATPSCWRCGPGGTTGPCRSWSRRTSTGWAATKS